MPVVRSLTDSRRYWLPLLRRRCDGGCMAKVTALRPLPVNRCAGTNKAGKPCKAKPLSGRDRCTMHDPDKGPQVRKAGVAARAERGARRLTEAQAAELLQLEAPDDLPRTVERVARLVATGQLDAKAANVVIQAAGIAQRGHEPAREARERAGACAFCGRVAKQVGGWLFRKGAASICEGCHDDIGGQVAQERIRAVCRTLGIAPEKLKGIDLSTLTEEALRAMATKAPPTA